MIGILLLAASLAVSRAVALGDASSAPHPSSSVLSPSIGGSPPRRALSIELPGGIPLELVEATNGFFIGRYEVTQEQWFSLSKADKRTHYGKRLPIERISCGECLDFLAKANALDSVRGTGLRLRLPTEAEWEMCCRAGGTGTSFGLGADGGEGRLDDMGWHAANSGNKPHEVGLKESNAWGIFDMVGNMFEMCATFAYGAVVVKGGGWASHESSCRASFRLPVLPINIHDDLGFRVAADASHDDPASSAPQWESRASSWPLQGDPAPPAPPAPPALHRDAPSVHSPSSLVHLPSRDGTPPRVSVELPGGVPLELVEATNGFFIGKYEVTQEQWRSLMKSEKSIFSGDLRRPVECLVWSDCMAFVERANALDSVRGAGLRLRLPTEAEWEMCCRAGEPDAPSGTALDERAWHWKNAMRATHLVGEKAPNAWGLHDMLGNVWELCSTVAYGFCVVKGGDWETSPEKCFPSYRNPVWPHEVDPLNHFGFRLAADRLPTLTPDP